MVHKTIKHIATMILIIARLAFLWGHKTDTPDTDRFETTPTENTQHNTHAAASQTQTIQLNPNEWQNHSTILERIYNRQADTDIGISLVTALAQNKQFTKAYHYAQIVGEQNIPAATMLQLYLHQTQVSITNNKSIQHRTQQVEKYRENGRISNDDYLFYQALEQLRNNNIQSAQVLLKQITAPKYSNFANDIQQQIQDTTQKQDIPGYYTQARIALKLLQYGYIRIAQKLALEVSLQNDKYILPYQILSQADFVQEQWTDAISYLIKLQQIDPQQEQTYLQMLGIASYQNQQYEQAIMYLQQVNDPRYTNSANMYILLSYLDTQDISNIVKTQQKLLAKENLNTSDFYTFFYHTLYKPWIEKTSYTLYNSNPNLTELYLTKCRELLPQDPICNYGEAGIYLTQNNRNQAGEILQDIAPVYNESYLRESLGDYYLFMQSPEQAKQAYLEAIGTTDTKDTQQLQSKILAL